MDRKTVVSLFRWGVGLGLPLALIALFEVCKGDRERMDGWVFGVMAPVEQALGRLWSHLPFSAAEVLTALLLAGSALWLIRAVVLLVRRREGRAFLRRLLAFGGAVLWLLAAVCWMWNAAYYASNFSQRSGLATGGYTVEELSAVTAFFARQAAALSDQVPREENGSFSRDIEAFFHQGPQIYQNLTREFPCLEMESVQAKPLLCSRLQSILGFTGVYFPFTGEANVNVDAPACLIPATIAHEMSHQRMVALEDEANFVGIAACVTSEDPVFQYSGYLMGLIHLCNALYPVAPDLWYEIAGKYFTAELSTDWNDNNAYWAQRSSQVEETASELYDTFLKGNDQQLGIRSYGACVDLLVAYFS